MNQKEIPIRPGEKKREIHIATKREKNYVIIIFSDTGPGLSEEVLDHIFDPFYSTRKKMGLGGGLATCQGIIEAHNGTITAENRPAGGAAFTITLPVQ